MVTTNTRTHLLGRDENRTRQWGIGAGGLFVASLIYFAAVTAGDSPAIHLALWWEGYAVFLIALIALQAYSNGGLAVSWALTFCAIVGVILNYGGIALFGNGPGIVELLALATVGGMMAAAIIGTFGFGIGMIARRIVS